MINPKQQKVQIKIPPQKKTRERNIPDKTPKNSTNPENWSFSLFPENK
jgi:hypothetical protein